MKWKDAFELNDNFKSYVALNPLQNFFTTLQFRKPSFDDKKVKTFLFSVIKFLFSTVIETAKWNKNYDALVIYFLTDYRSRFVMQESMMIKAMYDEFKLRKDPQPLKSIAWVNNMGFDVFQTGI